MRTLIQDLHYGVRMLAKNPGFTAVAILTLALGIGASTAVFSVVNTVLLQPLPYTDPARLVAVESMDTRGVADPSSLSYPDFFDFRAQNHVFEHLVTSRDTNLALTGQGEPQQLDGEMVTWDLFSVLGIVPQLGRGFLPSEEAAGSHAAVLSHQLWQSRFGGNPGIVGRTITLNRKAYTVVGVAPAGFVFPANEPKIQLWTTIADDREAPPGDTPMTEQRGAHMLTAVGRLKTGITIEQARADVSVIAASLAKQYPDSNANHVAAFVRPALETLIGEARLPLLILLGAVGLLLLIACANIANLLLARTTAREHEIAVRAALGASGVRVVRQLLTESLLLAVLGGSAGVGLATYTLQFILPLGAKSIPRLAQVSIDGRVLFFSLLLALVTSLLFGMAPALEASKVELSSTLKEQTRGTTDRHDRLRGGLVTAQVTLGLVLVSAAGLLMASFLHLERSDLGFRPDHLLTYWFSLPEPEYSPAEQVAFYDQLLERMRSLPGVQSAAGVWPLPLGGDNATVSFDITERPAPAPSRPAARMALATPAYFATAGIRLLKGRFFTEHDDKTSSRVLIVNKAFADKYFAGEDVIGKTITPGATDSGEKEMPREIVGVVGSAKLFALDAEPQPIYYFPYKQLAWQPPVMMLRTAVPPRTLESAIRGQMAKLDPLVPVFQIRTMDELMDSQVVAPRFQTLLLGGFAGIALLLTMVGLYGVVAFSVSRRTREIGLRLALGAARADVLIMVLKQAMKLVLIGLGLGIVGALAAGQLLRSMLFGVNPIDPAVLAAACLLIGMTGALASYLPARRATRVDPMVTLRYE